MKYGLCILTAVLAGGLWAGPAVADDGAPASGGDLSEAELREIMLRRQEVPSTEPDEVLERKPEIELPAAGSMVVARKCRLRPDPKTGWVVLEFLPGEGRRRETSRWALPCERLEKMEAVAAANPDAVFRISGRTTLYHGRPFLLITTSPLLVSTGTADADAEAGEATPEPERAEEPTPGEAEPEADAAEAAPEPAAEDVAADALEGGEDAGASTTRPAGEAPDAGENLGPTADEMFEALIETGPHGRSTRAGTPL